jgi:hypothetical protein
VISQAHNKEAEKMDQELVTDAVKDDSRQASDEIEKKRRRKKRGLPRSNDEKRKKLQKR